MWETQVRSVGWEDPLEKAMATYSSTLAWKIPWTEEPDRLQSMGLQRVGHDWVTSLHFTSLLDVIRASLVAQWWRICLPMPEVKVLIPGKIPWRGERGNPLQYACMENSMDRGAWWATVHRVTKSWTRLKQLDMHTCTRCYKMKYLRRRKRLSLFLGSICNLSLKQLVYCYWVYSKENPVLTHIWKNGLWEVRNSWPSCNNIY